MRRENFGKWEMKDNVRKRRLQITINFCKKDTEREQNKRRITVTRKIGYARYYGGKREIHEER